MGPRPDKRRRCRRHQRLAEHLPAEHLRRTDVAALAAEQIHLQRLELEQLQQIRETVVHRPPFDGDQPNLNLPCISALWPGKVHR